MLSLARRAAGDPDFRRLALGRSDDPRVVGSAARPGGSAPLLGLVALRADFRPSWADHPAIEHLPLERLTREHSAAIVDGLIERDAPVGRARRAHPGATDGVPLFVEELTKALLEADSAGRRAPDSESGSSIAGRHSGHHPGFAYRPVGSAWRRQADCPDRLGNRPGVLACAAGGGGRCVSRRASGVAGPVGSVGPGAFAGRVRGELCLQARVGPRRRTMTASCAAPAGDCTGGSSRL